MNIISSRRKQLRKTSFRSLPCLFIICLFFGCAANRIYTPPVMLPDDTRSIPEPKFQKMNFGHDAYNKIITHQVKQSLDFSRQLLHVFGKPKQALNVDRFGKVLDSSWFTNRNARRRMSLEEIMKGPDTGVGPDSTQTWILTRAKLEGVTPGFHIKDSRGDRYVIKFDPVGYSELATGAEVVCTKIFYAAGYNVPENYITYFDPSILKIGEEVKFIDDKGIMRFMTGKDLEALLNKVERLPDGRIRALASKYVDGKDLGGFKYLGTRDDDPNDIVPHEHRRELRGLYVLIAWLKHFDTKAGNNMDVFVSENGRHFVKHYLIDFGSALGSDAIAPQSRHKGHEFDVDTKALFGNILSFGLYVKSWEKLGDIQYPSIGRFDSHDFNPGDSRSNYPNPAFENCTNLDGYWGAKLVMSFTDMQLEAIVKQGQYSNPEAEAYLLKTIKERRDKTGRYWYSRVNPLDKFKITRDSSGACALGFEDSGVAGNLWPADQSKYFYDFSFKGETFLEHIDLGNQTSIPLEKLEEILKQKRGMTEPFSSEDQWEITLRVQRYSGRMRSKWVKVYLTRNPATEEFELLGIHRKN